MEGRKPIQLRLGSPSVGKILRAFANNTSRRLGFEGAVRPPSSAVPATRSRMEVGRTPVREAIQRLQYDGFVVVSARRGTFVSKIDINDLTAVYEARARIESWATRLAAERLREFERQEARQLIDELKQTIGPMALEDILALDRRVHRFIYKVAKNSFLFDTLDHYHNLSLRILYVAMKRFPALVPRLEDVLHDQVLMLEAVCRGDADEAEKIAMAHVMSFESEVRKVI